MRNINRQKSRSNAISKNASKFIGRREKDDLLGATIVQEKPSVLSKVIFFVLCGLMFFAVAAYGAVDSWSFAFLFIGITGVSILWLTDSAINGELRFSRNKLQVPLIGLILIGLFQLLPLRNAGISPELLNLSTSSTLSLDGYATRLFVLQLIALLVFFAAMLTYLNNQHRLRALTNFIIIFGFSLAILGILQRLSSNKIYWIREVYMARPFGTYINSHHFAALMEMTIAVTLGLVYTRSVQREKQFLYIFATIIMGVALLMTNSRGGLISLFGVIAFLTLATFLRAGLTNEDEEVLDDEFSEKISVFERKLMQFGGGLALLIVVVGIGLFLSRENSISRSVTLAQSGGDFSTGRLHFWGVSWEIIKNYPIFGVGFDAFGVAYTKYDSWNGTMRVERAHNEYLQALTDAGIFGLVCVIAFIFRFFRQGFHNLSLTLDPFRRGAIVGALAGCFGIFIHSFFDFPLRTPANALIFLSLVALATAQIVMPRIYKRE